MQLTRSVSDESGRKGMHFHHSEKILWKALMQSLQLIYIPPDA